MNLVLPQNYKKIITSFCLFIYIMFTFLSNMGATLCFGTTTNRHIGIHALNYDSCPDEKICNFTKSRSAFSGCKNKFDYSNFQINLNKIPLFNSNEIFQAMACSEFVHEINLFEEKYNKINWNIYDDYNIKTHLGKLETIILII